MEQCRGVVCRHEWRRPHAGGGAGSGTCFELWRFELWRAGWHVRAGGSCRQWRQAAPGQAVFMRALDTPVHFWLSGTLCPDQMFATDAVCFRE